MMRACRECLGAGVYALFSAARAKPEYCSCLYCAGFGFFGAVMAAAPVLQLHKLKIKRAK